MAWASVRAPLEGTEPQGTRARASTLQQDGRRGTHEDDSWETSVQSLLCSFIPRPGFLICKIHRGPAVVQTQHENTASQDF